MEPLHLLVPSSVYLYTMDRDPVELDLKHHIARITGSLTATTACLNVMIIVQQNIIIKKIVSESVFFGQENTETKNWNPFQFSIVVYQ